jgi:hypothetical protein
MSSYLPPVEAVGMSEAMSLQEIFIAQKQMTVRRPAVSACAAHLLYIVLNRLGEVVVYHPVDI